MLFSSILLKSPELHLYHNDSPWKQHATKIGQLTSVIGLHLSVRSDNAIFVSSLLVEFFSISLIHDGS